VGDKIQKRATGLIKRDSGQYIFTFSVLAVVLYAVGIPFFALVLLGAFAFFLLKIFNSESYGEARQIFEFYLRSAEILRNGDRHWFGFEMRDTIAAGERIVRSMPMTPPLVGFTLGALYHRVGEYDAAGRHLEAALGNAASKESTILEATPTLKEYVRLLRKIEREPGESPKTASAIRSLERLRKTHGAAMLSQCRDHSGPAAEFPLLDSPNGVPPKTVFYQDGDAADRTSDNAHSNAGSGKNAGSRGNSESPQTAYSHERKTISEVLQDIYDDKVQ